MLALATAMLLAQFYKGIDDYAPNRESAESAVWAAYGICYKNSGANYHEASTCWKHLETRIDVRCDFSSWRGFEKCAAKTASVMRNTPITIKDAYLICSTHGAEDKVRGCTDYLSGQY